MKPMIRIVAAVGAFGMLLFGAAGCKAAATQNSNVNNTANSTAQSQVAANGTQGIITAVSDNSITVAVMPTGGFGGQQQGQPPQGSGQPSGTGAPQQPMPTGSANANAPSGTPGAMPTMDTSGWQKQTFTIDSNTKIAQGQGPGSSAAATALKVSDLKVGGSVSITARSGQASVADTITVMQGFGGGPGGQQNGTPVTTATAKS